MIVLSAILHVLVALGLVFAPQWRPDRRVQAYQVQLVSMPVQEPAPKPKPAPVVVPPKPRPVRKPVDVKPPVKKPKPKTTEGAVKPTERPGPKPAVAPAPAEPAPPQPEVKEPPPEPAPPPPPREQVASIPQSEQGINLVAPLMEAVALKYPAYFRALERKMYANWSPPGGGDLRQVLVTFTILRDGSVYGTTIEQSSGNVFYDQAALRSVLRSTPFPPLPASLADDTLKIYITFVLDPQRNY